MYKLKLHKNLNRKKWQTFNRYQQILMVANELNRAKNWIIKGDLEETNNCYERAFELLDLTISVVTRRSLLKELLRFREMLATQYISKEKDNLLNQKLFDVLLSLNKDGYNLYFS
ncbi:MAG: hypothetical protein COT45_00530 [bacterium (Candidatus Stahlbacteria) CG08_land_8_20_14_0_20_40_26]|nr:MAG: hypothetical protein COX49_07020 [bacterium (Candidatus Stahlbacteria) CG23_combo_of_CG06-09_8_20_14_all_40_9]PIS26646.1 MAG: hypothetical protein COT45_00530 [bacterium (Candidatus Stahlbacteria) CG08_land_8_20_14_0_20_40_26]